MPTEEHSDDRSADRTTDGSGSPQDIGSLQDIVAGYVERLNAGDEVLPEEYCVSRSLP